MHASQIIMAPCPPIAATANRRGLEFVTISSCSACTKVAHKIYANVMKKVPILIDFLGFYQNTVNPGKMPKNTLALK